MRLDPFGNPLHVRMHYKHGAYWYVYQGKWIRIGRDYTVAMQNYAAAIAPAGGMAKLIAETYRWYEKRQEKGDMTMRSLRQYRMARETIDTAFADFSPAQVKPHHIAQFLDFYYEDRQAMGNTSLVVLRAIFDKGTRWGECEYNPAKQIARFKKNKRTRYIKDDELVAIRKVLTHWMRVIVDMCYLTGQRIGDVLHIRQSDITDDGIYFEQQKTKKRLLVESSPELTALIREARGSSKVVGIYLFSKTATKPRHYSSVRRHWVNACEAVNVEDAVLHDIRAKAATDADAQGKDAQALMGHATPAMTENYLRLLRTDRVQSPAGLRKMR